MIIDCIERMSVDWIIKVLIELGLILLVVSIAVLAILFFLFGNDVNERSRKYEMSAMRIKEKIESNRHKDNT